MNDTVNHHLEAFRGMHELCGLRASAVAPTSLATQLFSNLSTQLTDLMDRTASRQVPRCAAENRHACKRARGLALTAEAVQ